MIIRTKRSEEIRKSDNWQPMRDEKMYTRWVPMYLNYDEAKLHKDTLTKEEWDGFLDWFWGLGKTSNSQECMGWIFQTESDHPTYFENIELFNEMFKQYKEDGEYKNEK